jgi:hypothetical protein
MTADNNIHTKLVAYVVWQQGDTPQQGFVIMAKSAFDARRKRAKELGLAGVSTLMARIKE